jgi:hypothetical protein
VLHADARAADKDADDVESVVLAGESVAVDPDLSGPAKLTLLVPVHGFNRITELGSSASFDLYERDQPTPLRDDVYVAMAAPEPPLADPPPFVREPLSGHALAERTQRLLGVLHARSVRVLLRSIITTSLRPQAAQRASI